MRASVAAFAAVSLVALSAAMGAASPVLAQASPEPNVTDIVVTAQKRTQSLQDVPIVVTAVSKQQLQDAGIHDIKDLTIVTPGLMVTSTSSEASTTAASAASARWATTSAWKARSAWRSTASTARATRSALATSASCSGSRC